MENIISCPRRIKAATETFYLLEVNKQEINDSTIVCKILNTKHKEYTITLIKHNHKTYPLCNCPDSLIKGNICKHIYWLGLKKIGNINPNCWNQHLLNVFFERYYLPNSLSPGRNEDCPICLEKINHNNDSTIKCAKGCNISVHTNCWSKYVIISGKINFNNGMSTKCVCCRRNTMPKWVRYSAPYYE